jgi:hypothetical protein
VANGACTFEWITAVVNNAPSRSYKSDCKDGGTVDVVKFRAHNSIAVYQTDFNSAYLIIEPDA